MAINKIQTAGGTENILGNIGIRRNGNGYLIAGDMKAYNAESNDNPFNINVPLATINGKCINQNANLSAGLMKLDSYNLYLSDYPHTIGKELYNVYLPFTSTITKPLFPISSSDFSSLPYFFYGFPDYNRFGAAIAAGIINLGRTVAMTLEEGDVLFGFNYRYRVRYSLALDIIGKWYVIDFIDVMWVEGAERPEFIHIEGHCVNRSVTVSYSSGVTSDTTEPDETDTFSFSYSNFGSGDDAEEEADLYFNSNYFKNFYGQRNELPVVGNLNNSYFSSTLASNFIYVVTGKLSTPPVSGTDGFASVGIATVELLTINESGTLTPCYTKNDGIQLYLEDLEDVSESFLIGGNTIEVSYTRRNHSFNPNLSTLLNPLQPQLVSGTNIKTVNNQSLLGEGNITIEGGGGQSYTAGDNITIENNVISAQVPEQRVLIDEDNDSGLHSGFIVKSPHWRNDSGDIDLGTWGRMFGNNIPVENADPYTQAGYLVNGRMTVTFKDLQYNDGESPTYASEPIYGYLEINGTVIGSGETVTFTGTEADHTISSGDTLVMDSSSFYKISGLIEQELANNYMSYETVVYVPSYTWSAINTAFVVHNGAETRLVDYTGIETAVSSAVGMLYMQGATPVSRTSMGPYTYSHVLIVPDADITYPGQTTISGKTAYQVRIPNKLTNPDKNLTVGFDTTYQEQAIVTNYSYEYGIEAMDFFGDSVYGGSWAGQTGTFVENTAQGYGVRIPVTNIATDILFGKGLCFYTYNNMTSQNVGIYLTVNNGALQINAIAGSDEWYDDMSGMNFHMGDFIGFLVNGTMHTYNGTGTQTLIADISNLTDLFIVPSPTGASQYQMYMPSMYIQVCGVAPSADNPTSSILWPYETSGTVTRNYENAPDRLNHYIRFAGATGSAVANRKAYLLTDLNVAQAAYIQQLEARVAALETRLNNYNGNNMSIETQYPGGQMSGLV